MRTTIVLFILGAALAGCAGPPEGGLPKYQVGDETVYVDDFQTMSMSYPSINAYAAAAPAIALVTVTGTEPIAAERQPADTEEGVAPGEGPDLYGVITFTVTEVFKGRLVVGQTLRLVYESGKRDGKNQKQRIAYVHSGLQPFQTKTGDLRPASDFATRTFVVFVQPNTRYPVFREDYALFHAQAVAEIVDSGLRFADPDAAPVQAGRGRSVPVTLADLRSATMLAPPR